MTDKSLVKYNLNDRQKEIDEIVDNLIPNDYINVLINKYSEQLKYYTYIDSVHIFSTLKLKGSMKYINKYNKQLRYGGLLTKIFNKNNKWFAIIKKPNNKIYCVSFDLNYIFYCQNIGEIQNENFKKNLDNFLTNCENGEYEIV